MKKLLFIPIFLSLMIVSCSNNSLKSDTSTQTNETKISIKDLSGEELQNIQNKTINENKTLIIDVRTKEEYDSGHLLYAVNIPLDFIEKNPTYLSRYIDNPIILYCRSGRRSMIAADILLKNQFIDISNADGVSNYNYNLSVSHKNLILEEFKEKLSDENIFIIDARDSKDFISSHINNSVNINMSNLSSNLDNIPKDREILIYSYNGYESANFAEELYKNGYENISNSIYGTDEYDLINL